MQSKMANQPQENIYSAEIDVSGTSDFLRACYYAIKPKEEDQNKRNIIKVFYLDDDKKRLKIKLLSKDATALRAAVNSISKQIAIVEKTYTYLIKKVK